MPSGDQVARRLYVKSDVRVGEPTGGGQAPTTDQLMTLHSTAETALGLVTYSSAQSPAFRGFRSYGSASAPTPIESTGSADGTNLGALRGYGYNGSTWVNGGAVRVAAAETWTTSANGTMVSLSTITTGTTGPLTGRWLVDGGGRFRPSTEFDNTYDLGSTAGRVRTVYATAINIGADSTAGGSFEVFLANSTTIPSANPSGGGVLYVSSGALIYRGSSGSLTTLGAA
ncbi:MAG: hypothetical protein A2W26_03565 [Acidobacteria bacterium RBG_16_64_8]|nr:MAG: hypothetical protein A2W26_03565 [Acidobacteria bacterium RBG_16_64_8]